MRRHPRTFDKVQCGRCGKQVTESPMFGTRRHNCPHGEPCYMISLDDNRAKCEQCRAVLNQKTTREGNAMRNQQPRPVITLEPPWWKCAHGTEFQSPSGKKPQGCPRTPSCRGEDIQMVIEVDSVFSGKETRRK